MIKLGTQPHFSVGTREETYQAIAQAGFESVDYGLMSWYTDPIWKLSDAELRERMENERKFINSHGVIVGQTHSPMDALWVRHPETKEERWHAQIQAIKATAYLGSPFVVIHPLCPPERRHKRGKEEAKALNMEFYNFLKPYLKEYNVKAAIENLFSFDPILGRCCETSCSTPAELKEYIDTLNSDCDRFVACFDIGHAVLGGNDPVSMIYELGQYIQVTHIQDNDLLGDMHGLPGMGKIDWYSVGKAFNDIGFDKVFNYEVIYPGYHNGSAELKNKKQLTLDFIRLYAKVGRAILNVK